MVLILQKQSENVLIIVNNATRYWTYITTYNILYIHHKILFIHHKTYTIHRKFFEWDKVSYVISSNVLLICLSKNYQMTVNHTRSKTFKNHVLWNPYFNVWIFFFVLGFKSHSRIFHWYGDVTVTDERLQIFTYARHLRLLISYGCLACQTYCNTGHFSKTTFYLKWNQ